MTDPMARYQWKHQDYQWISGISGRGMPRWQCQACFRRTSNTRRHDATCEKRERDTSQPKAAFAPNPWSR